MFQIRVVGVGLNPLAAESGKAVRMSAGRLSSLLVTGHWQRGKMTYIVGAPDFEDTILAIEAVFQNKKCALNL